MATSFKGGYDYEFVYPRPTSLECPICLLTLHNPHIISCCGNHFCHTCIDRIQRDGKPCPLCNEPDFTTFLHKGVQRDVEGSMIYCRWKPLGCDWEGELRHLEGHLHPGVGSRESGCGYVIVECRYRCGDRFERRIIADHELHACPQRSIEVQLGSFAKRFESKLKANEKKLYDVITENKKKLDDVIAENKIKFDDVIAENQAICTENKELRRQVNDLKQTNVRVVQRVQLLEGKQVEMRKELATQFVPVTVPPFLFTIYNFTHYRSIDYRWRSPPFYSHPGGYKLRCVVYPNGCNEGKGNHLSLFVAILHGEFDNQLKWPFNGVVTIAMYNRVTKQWDNDTNIAFDEHVPICYRERSVDRVANFCYGDPHWISNKHLNFNYLNYVIVCFKVTKVELK